MKNKIFGIILLLSVFLIACGKEETVTIIDTTPSWEKFSLSECGNEDYATVQNDVKEFLTSNFQLATYVDDYSGTNSISFSTTGLPGDVTKSNCLNSFMEHIRTTVKDDNQQLSNFCLSIAEIQGEPLAEEEKSTPQRIITLSYDIQTLVPEEPEALEETEAPLKE